MTDDTDIGTTGRQFPATRYSLIESTRSHDAQARQHALGVLICAYWKPVYKYLRLHWKKDNEAAQDLTQAFFARLLEKQLLDRFDPARARLRTYLRVCVDSFVINEDQAARRLKRGGDVTLLSLDFETAEGELLQGDVAASGDPDELFSREFARNLFALAVERLRNECADKGKQQQFQIFELYDIEAGSQQLTYDEVASRFRIKPTDVTNQLAYARREFRRIVLDELRALSASEDEFRHEVQTVLGIKL